MQSLASLMSFGKPDIANIEDMDDEDTTQDTDADTTAKINELASQFGLLTEDLQNDEGGKLEHPPPHRAPFSSSSTSSSMLQDPDNIPGMCCVYTVPIPKHEGISFFLNFVLFGWKAVSVRWHISGL